MAAALGLVCFLALQLQIALSLSQDSVAILSPVNGIVLSALVASRRRRWWAYLLAGAAACAAFDLQQGLAVPTALGYAVAKTAEVAFVAFLVRQQLGDRSPCESFDGLRHLVTGIAVGSALGVSWRILVFLVAAPDLSANSHSLWLTWFLADALGLLVFSAFLLSWFAQGIEWLRAWTPARYLEAAALLVLAGFQYPLFEQAVGFSATGTELLYLTFPFIIWAAVRFEVTGAAAVALIVALNAVWLTFRAEGPFVGGSAVETALSLQYFLAVVVGTALILGATIRESRRGQAALEEARARQETHISALQVAHYQLEVQASKLGDLAEGFAREKAEAKAANDAKSAFLATMSHELRTPMVGILGMADLMLGSELSGQQRRYVSTIRKSGEALIEITNDVLDFAKIEAGRLELVDRDFQVVALVDGVTELLGSTAHAKGIVLAAFVAPGVPRQLRGDPNRLRQVLINLVGNAIKFTDSGGVSLEAEIETEVETAAGTEVETAAGGGVRLRVTVSDTGAGIATDDQKHLFKRFNQVDPGGSESQGGTGLGLAICKQLITLMGGEIGVESKPGEGCRFWFTVPIRETAVEENHTDRAAPDWLRHVLVMDGNAVSRKIWRRHLAALGVEAEVVGDTAAALSALSGPQVFDLIVVDEDMPVEGQGQVIGQARQDPDKAPRLWQVAFMRGRQLTKISSDLAYDATLAKPLCHQSLDRCFDGQLPDQAGESPREAATGEGGSPMAPEGEAANPASRAGKGTGQRSILLVEDNKVNQMLGFAILSAAGYQVDLAASGLEAVEAVQLTEYQMILMDIRMPEMDGREAARKIRALGGWAGRVPIIAMTAEALPEDRALCLEAGMDDYIAKPVERDELLGKIAACIQPSALSPAVAGDPGDSSSSLQKTG